MKIRSFYLTGFLYLFVTMLNFNIAAQQNRQKIKAKSYAVGFMNNVFSEVDLNDARAALKIWVNETIRLYNGQDEYQIHSIFYENISDLSKSIRNNDLAFISMSTYDYLAQEKKLGLEPVLVPEIEGELGVKFCLLVNRSAGINNIRDLKGKAIGLIANPISIASRLWLDVLLAKNNLLPKEKYFNRIEGSSKDSQAILNLFFGNLDACIVPEKSYQLMKELNPQVGEKLKSILISDSFMPGFICYVSTSGDEQFKQHFCSSTIKLQEHNAGRQMLTLLKIGKLVPFKDQYLDSFRDLLKEHRKISLKVR
ncbi:MAG: phosphate/phosphite/phosphonate ABC transporter substrate-binding protein [Syntrophothermus sp.]